MHKSHEAVTKEIDDIVCHGITTSNLHTLGELVDIKKDVEEMWSYRNVYPDLQSGSSIEDVIADIKYLCEKMKTTDSVELHSNFKSDIAKILMYAEKSNVFLQKLSWILMKWLGLKIYLSIKSFIVSFL